MTIEGTNVITLLHIIFNTVVILIIVYTIRHYMFTLNRLLGRQRHPYVDIDTADWPTVTVLVAAHNEESVIGHSLEALLQVNYPQDKMEIVVVNDRSKDRTAEIVNDFALRYPGRIKPFHRSEGKAGKAAALKDASQSIITREIVIIFDADYIPGRGLIKQLVSPFFDPEVGLVMGRVVPVNTARNLLTRLLDMERSGGYQVDQQARMNMGLLPQYGGTVGGARKTMLDNVGGWRDDTLAEDTDLTYRALIHGWKTVYQNRSECYEEVPETWPARIRQIMRWAKGHNQTMFRYMPRVIFSRQVGFWERMDALLLLGVYIMSPVVLIGWIVAMILFYMGEAYMFQGEFALLCIIMYGAIGNFAAFFEISSAVYLDGGHARLRLLPFNFFNFLISILSVSRSGFSQFFSLRRRQKWDKTPRFRSANFKVK